MSKAKDDRILNQSANTPALEKTMDFQQ
jgi:hypothetical protein